MLTGAKVIYLKKTLNTILKFQIGGNVQTNKTKTKKPKVLNILLITRKIYIKVIRRYLFAFTRASKIKGTGNRTCKAIRTVIH